MISIIRQTGTAARISRCSFRTAATRPSVRLSNHNPLAIYRISAQQQQARGYANGDGGPKDPKKDSEKVNVTNHKRDLPSKPARGTENLYDNKTPLSPKQNKVPESPTQNQVPVPPEQNQAAQPSETAQPDKAPQASEGSKLDPEELKLFTQLFDDLRGKLMLPKGHMEIYDRAVENIKKEGIPDEVRKLILENNDGPMTIWKAMKIAALITNWDQTQRGKTNAQDTKPDSKEHQHEAGTGGAGGTGGTGGSSKDKKKEDESREYQKFTIFGRKFDGTSLIATLATVFIVFSIPMGTPAKEISFQEFRNSFFDKGLVEKLTVDNSGRKVRVHLHPEATKSVYPDSPASNGAVQYYFSIGSVEAFERRIDEAQEGLGIPTSERVPITYASPNDTWALFMYLLPTLLFIAPIIYIARRGSAGGAQSNVFGMGKSRAKKFNHETDVQVKFKDVAGMDEAKQEIMEFVSFLKQPEQFQKLGAKIPRGAILSGPPGTGKTLLAKATAGESQVPFFSVSGSEFVEMFVGVGASRVRDLFAMARKSTPCIIFIDEIDAIGKARSKGGSFGGNDEREATLNQILTEMDGFNTSEQVVVLAGTNRADVLDKALLRPGRFDRHIAIDRPTMDGRKQIFLVHLRKIVTNEDMDYLSGRLAALTPGFAGADIANCCNEAALIAARYNATSVAMTHFEQAIERVIGGLEKKSLVLSPEEKKTVAYHEAGHAICGWYFKHADPLLKVSIIPRGQGALGYAQYLPAGDTYLMNVNQLMDRMAMTLGGRISEELHFESVTSGASDDFNKVTRMATAMVTKWGMSKKLGPLHFEDDENKFHKPFAESTAQTIDSEVRRIVDEAYKQCHDLLTAKKKEVGIIAEELLSKEVLGRDDMVRLLGPRPFDENKDFTKYFGGGGTSAPPPFPGETTDTQPDRPMPV